MKIAEANDVKELKEAEDKNRRVAAFFDLDGTLLPPPSLEQRFFQMLRDCSEIAIENYLFWFHEALELASRGINAVVHGNKMYLRGVRSLEESRAGNQIGSRVHESGHPSQVRASEGEGRPSMPPKHNPRWPVPHFLEDGVERVAWHAMRGHAIVIVSGTLEPLANAAGRALESELAAHGIGKGIRVCATSLEECDGRWTGRLLSEPMFGKAKALAILVMAKEMKLDLSQSWAYGDSAQDRWMLGAVGNPVAVNPSARLGRIAKKGGWSVLHWCAKKGLAQSSQRAQGRGSMTDEVLRNECALRDAERCA